MPVLRRRAQVQNENGKLNQIPNGLYIHSSPPRALQMSSAHVKQIIRSGDIDKLEQLVLDGHGKKLLGEYSADYKTRVFLKTVPTLMSKISLLHDAVNSGRIEELQSILDEEPTEKRKRLVTAKDEAGVGLLHKAIYYDLKDIYKYLIDKFPQTIPLKDSEGRTAYHYTPMCKDAQGVQKLLITAGADSSSLDFRQHSAKYYVSHPQELELPTSLNTRFNSKTTLNQESLNIKKSNIRIWIHQRNLANLQQVVWEGHGSKLVVEHSNNPKIKKFLEAVPHIMGLIKNVHTDVQNDDIEALKGRLSPPIPPVVLSGKDVNGLTPLHKAAGLGKQDIAEFIIQEYPKGVNLTDAEGKTPLHYAALLKDGGKMTNLLLDNSADESALDNKQKTAAYYKTRTSEIDAKLLNVVPECPRTANESFMSSFDWSMLTSCVPPSESMSKISKKIASVISNGHSKSSEDAPEADEQDAAVEDKEEEEEVKTENVNEEPSVTENEKDDEDGNIQNENENEDNKNETEEKMEEEEEVKIDPSENEKVEEEEGDNNNNNNDEEAADNSSRPQSIKSGSRTRPGSRMVETVEDTVAVNNEEEMLDEIEAAAEATVDKALEEATAEEIPAESAEYTEGIIEGVVNGENEVETMNEEGQDANEDKGEDEEITALVEEGNMEQLAALVLNGDGDRLMGQKSDNPELQSFLDNVSVYMSKINRIHVAAKNGSLRDLQAALDRRKFAIAKDKISPNGASPLHTAVVFGNTSIVRYLAGRFPETAQVTDDDGRTPLHYAAVLNDNSHYYNLLMHLGADNRTEDKLFKTPEYYRTNQEEFNHRKILQDFGVEESFLKETLKDKVPNDTYSARKDLDDEDMLNVLERCYNVLHGRRNSNTISAVSTLTSSSSTIYSSSSSLLSKHLKRYIFDSVKNRLTKLDHNLYDIIWPSVKKLPTEMSFRIALDQDFPGGIIAPDYYVYRVFPELLEPIIKEFNSIDLHSELGNHPHSKFGEVDKEDEKTNVEIDLDLDPNGKWIIADNTADLNDGQMDMPFFATEEGRYLASSLGDPLIKGLTEVANKRPEDPIAYLATYLYNFANNRHIHSRGKTQENQQTITGLPEETDNNNAVPASIDVVTVEPEEDSAEDDSAFNSTSRDEHGQSMLHFAAARAHGRNALFQLLTETEINVSYRDELYRTARDISVQANIPENTAEIDRYVMHIATRGDTDKLVELLLDGYDHITDIVDESDVPIVEAVSQHNQPDTVSFLQSILAFEEKRERVHHTIRLGSINDVMQLLADENDTGSGKLLAIGKNSYGRCSLHIAVLCQQEEIVDYLANTFPDTLKLGDNLERTALHYSMGVEKMETISRVLIKAGAKRILKDLKGRQPTYYFLNKSEILRLQEEEETF